MSRREAPAQAVPVLPGPASTSQTLDRGLQVLEAVARAGDPLTVAEAAASVGLDRTVAHRLVATLAARGYLQRDSSGGYRLGPTCLALASAITDLRTTARPFLEELRDATGETVHVVVLSGREVVFLDGIESVHTLRVGSRTGRLLPAHATSVGKALLAALPPEQVRALYERADLVAVTGRTITDRDALERQLAAVRECGYATNHGESENGVGSIGVAVRNLAGEPRAALSVAMPLERWSEAAEEQAASVLKSAAAALGAHL
jgi:DNA-binding IclR family transcriptional regulator